MYDLGFFPLDSGPLHPESVCKGLARVFGVSLESVRLWATLSHRVLCITMYFHITAACWKPISLTALEQPNRTQCNQHQER